MDSPVIREDMPPLQFDVTATPTVLLIRVGGEVDVSNTVELHAKFAATVLGGHRALRLDLGCLTFCDTRGALLILEFLTRADRAGYGTTIRGATLTIQRLLTFLAHGDPPTFDSPSPVPTRKSGARTRHLPSTAVI